MERLVAWYRIGSSVGAVVALVVAIHSTIIVGGLAIATTGAPSAAVLILVLLKTALDLGLHLAEHRDDAEPVGTSALPREPAG